MSEMAAIGRCWVHGGNFAFDPDTVCSLQVDAAGHASDEDGYDASTARQVVLCDPCAEIANEEREQRGFPRIVLAREMPQ